MAGEFNRKQMSTNAHLGVLSGAALRAKNLVGATVGQGYSFGKPGSILARIVINNTAAGAIRIYDGSELKATLKASIAEGTYPYGFYFNNQGRIEIDAASDVTVIWAP